MLYSLNNDLVFSEAKNVVKKTAFFIFCISCIWVGYGFLRAKIIVSWNLIDFSHVGNWSNFNEPEFRPLNLHISPNMSIKYRAENRSVFRALSNIYDGAFLEKYIAVNYFRINFPSQTFGSIPNAHMEKALSFCFGIIHLVRKQSFSKD